ncbi:MAG: hypothetical protein HC908_10255 [Calothrix sp. SM1_7_51]|nr:hypothetical protein [Calothrix sp. SM1_7_51]
MVFIAGSPHQPSAVVCLDLVTRNLLELRRASELKIDTGYLSEPESIALSYH